VEFDLWFTLPVFRQWAEQGTLFFPDRCCRCLEPAEVWRESVRREGRGRNPLRLRGIPYCGRHGAEGQPEGLWAPWSKGSPRATVGLSLVVESGEFARQLDEQNRQGEPPPPWVAFPGKRPSANAWQRPDGGAWWFCDFWLPFWDSLLPGERAAYLDRHRAPEPWHSFLMPPPK
jgi:hypothetical protein